MFDARRQIGMIQKRQFSHEARRTFLLHVFLTRTKCRMSNVFVEPRPQGRLDGSPITDFVVEDHADHVLATFKTQEQTIHWARTHATYRTLHACATSTIRKSRITGGQYSKHSRAPNSSPTAPSRNYSLYVFASDVI